MLIDEALCWSAPPISSAIAMNRLLKISRRIGWGSASSLPFRGEAARLGPAKPGLVAAGWCPSPAYTTQNRSEEHTSELQSIMRISYAVYCLKKKTYYS